MYRLLCLSFALIIFYQATGASGDVRIGPVYAGKFPVLDVVIETPAKFTAQNLTLTEDGQTTVAASNIRPFKETGNGMAIVLALDVSGTMAGQPINEMKRALSAFLNQAGPRDSVAIVTIADDQRVKVDAPFGSSPEQLKAAANALAVRGRITELYKGLRQALALFDEAGLPERKRLIVISDGWDEGTAYKLEDVIEEALRRSVPVDAVGLTKVDPKYLSNLNRLADKTNGVYERAEDSEKLEDIFRRGIERLQSTPVATFTAAKLQADGQEHRVGLRLEANGRVATAETKLILNKREQVSPSPVATPAQSRGPAGFFSRWPKWIWAVVVAGLLAVVLLIVLFRRKSASAPQEFAPQASASNSIESDSAIEQPSPYDLPPPVIAPVIEPPGSLPGEPVAAEFAGQQFGGTMVDPLPQPEPQARVRRKTQIRTEFAPPAPGRPSALLMAEEGAKTGAAFAVEESPFWIGSEDANQLLVDGDTYLSGFHACIEYREGSLLLHDNNSTNGTFLNGEPVKEMPRPLSYGDRIKAGRSVFVVTRS
ncbi:MAG: VWA domain-containing protein [Acidobacteriota bacterium]